MADMSAATVNMVTQEDVSKKLPNSSEPSFAVPHTNVEAVGAEVQRNNESSPAEFQTNEPGTSSEIKKEPAPENLSQNEGQQGKTDGAECATDDVPVRDTGADPVGSGNQVAKPVKDEPKDEEMQEEVKIKEEFNEQSPAFTDYAYRNRQLEENTLVGKLKVKPLASLVQTNQPNPQPGMHPFFAGFDDHIRSLIMNRQPQYAMNSPMIQRPVQFMYYDNSTNMNLKKMLNGHKMGQVSRHPTSRPYVPINVPRPPRSQIPMRSSFSTQTPPMPMGQPDVCATPSTSSQWLPQSRPPVQNFTPQNNLPQNFTSPKNFSVPNFTPANNSPNPKLISSNAFTTPNFTRNKQSAPNVSSLQSSSESIVVSLHPNKVSTSSSTDDLENHSSGNDVIIKTEVDLGIDSKEDLQATLNECNLGIHFMETTDSTLNSSNVTPKLEITDTTPQHPLLTGDAVTPDAVTSAKESLKRHPAYELPAYSTKGLLLCKCCDFRCNKKKKMKGHFDSMHTAENHYKCFYCIKKLSPIIYFKTVHDLEHHVGKVHRREKRWQCKFCTKTYKCQASYKAHMENTCAQSHPYACHMCTFTCRTEAALEKHIKAHEKSQETHQCPFCQKMFKKYTMKQHLLSVHAPPEEKPFRCMSCNYGAGTQSQVEGHYKKTGHDRKFKCPYCDYASRSESIIKNHVRNVHQNKRNINKLICGVDGCQVKCVHSRSLRVHRQMHTMSESELFTCPLEECSMKFTTDQSLRYHINKTRHHKPFKCPDCSLRFLKEETLSRHIQSVHVTKLLKKLENPYYKDYQEPVCVKNVVDVYNYVESGGVVGTSRAENRRSEMCGGDDSVANFGCWLGISGFGDITDTTAGDIQATPQASDSEVTSENEEVHQMKKMEAEDEDEDYRNLIPITCLVECKQDDTEDNSNCSIEKTDDGLVPLKREEDDEKMDDSEYQHVYPELSCLVECQENATIDSLNDTNFNENEQEETDILPANLVKIEVEDKDPS